MDHGFDVVTQRMNKLRIGKIALDELGPAPHQMLNTLSATAVDPDAQTLLQRETREASADEAACAGDQNFHCLLRFIFFCL
jgi:hypothetical protein